MIFSVCQKNRVLGYSWSTQKPRFLMDLRPLANGRTANFGMFLDVFEFLCFGYFFLFFKKNRFGGYSWSNKKQWKPRFLMDQRPLVKRSIANFGIFLCMLSFCVLDDFFCFLKKFSFGVFLVHPTMVLVLLSALVKKFRTRYFFLNHATSIFFSSSINHANSHRLYRSYYLHWSRDSFFPYAGFF